jgi:hypothetical protein
MTILTTLTNAVFSETILNRAAELMAQGKKILANLT